MALPRLLILWLAPLVLAFAATPGAAVAGDPGVEFVVDSCADGQDVMIGDGICANDTDPPGACTLRAALTEANQTPAKDTITLPACEIVLSLDGVNSEDQNADGDLDILESVTIQGTPGQDGPATRIVVPEGRSHRAIDIAALFPRTVELFDLEIRGGSAANDFGVDGQGGVVRATYLPLRIERSVLAEGTAYEGGCLLSRGDLTIEDSVFEGCSSDIDGAAISAQNGAVNPVTVSIESTTIRDASPRPASTTLSGAGLYLERANATLRLSTITDSHASEDGGGVFCTGGSVLVDRSELRSNRADRHGGGLSSDCTTTILDSTLDDNESGLHGGALHLQGEDASLLVDRSTLSNNRADGVGGALWDVTTQTSPSFMSTLRNSTLSGNRAIAQGGAIYKSGSGSGSMSILNATLYGNEASAGQNLANYGGSGEDIHVAASILALPDTNAGASCFSASNGAIVSFGGNIAHDASCGFLEQSDAENTDPEISPLTLFSDERTATHRPLLGSPAIDFVFDSSSCDPVDQRGQPRPTNGFCDSGAVELPDSLERSFAPGDLVRGGARNSGEFQIGTVGATAFSNNWPASQTPEQAIDELGQGHRNYVRLDAGLLVVPQTGSSVARSIQIWTGNDSAELDPASFELWGTNEPITDGPDAFPFSTFTLVASGELDLPLARTTGGSALLRQSTSQRIAFPNTSSFQSYLVLFPTVRDIAMADSIQIGEVALYTPEPSAGLISLVAVVVLGALRRRAPGRARMRRRASPRRAGRNRFHPPGVRV